MVDWNNENRWDAHPDYITTPESAPWWWDESYGVNDWQESQAYQVVSNILRKFFKPQSEDSNYDT
ncbi:hypothetical protein [Spirochaeta lutea]|uniref:hypothetical protein n=1 Tax=Spirochaeta lutea TaxID=1480694 RepID=UPI00055D8214|nr:hypothetical protein [Spirochaeta lutea]